MLDSNVILQVGIIMKRYTLPRDTYYGPGALDALKDLHGEKAIVVVGGGSMKNSAS